MMPVAVTVIRSIPFRPTVIGAVLVLPALSFHLASRVPLRVMISALAGSGLVNVLRRSEPIVSLPFSIRLAARQSGS